MATTVEHRGLASPATRSGALVIACTATFISFLDLALVNLAFTSIAHDFPGSASTLTWVVNAYGIAFAATLAAAGRVADSVGHKQILLVGVAVFGLASLLCAIAPSMSWLITARAIQGVAGAALLPAALGAMLAVVTPQRTAAAVGAWAATGALAGAIGPAVGAVLVDWWGWRSAFAVNVPLCALLLVLGLLVLPPSVPRHDGIPDVFGVVALAGGIGATVAAITQAHRWGASSPLTLTLLVAGIISVAAVLVRSNRHPRPALHVRLWRHTGFALTNVVSAGLGHGMFAYLLAVPAFLTEVWQLTLMQAAACIGAAGTAAMIAAAAAGRHITAHNARWYATAGMLWQATGFALIATCFDAVASLGLWAVVALLLGSGVGVAITALSVLTATTVPTRDSAAGMAMNLTARQVGGVIGIAVSAAMISASDYLSAFHRLFAVLAAVAVISAAGSLALPALGASAARPAREDAEP
ncbi:MFS transporter (plasmid) [Nocardia sp. CA-084685]|uniref:MFS transporter n=1 Tax=Nocardia sp. CA-084685 TaxID=3239970 RepID=UPI003D99DC24